MPSDPSSTQLPADALDAFLEGLLSELKHPADPVVLGQIRAAFRRKIPFHLRSYGAALLIMRAAGLSRGVSARAQPEAVPAPVSATPADVRGRNPKKTVLAGDPSTRPTGKSASAPSPSAASRSAEGGFSRQNPTASVAPVAPAPRKPPKETPKETPARTKSEKAEKSEKDKPEKSRARAAKPEKMDQAVVDPPREQIKPEIQAARPRQTSWALSVPSTPLFVSMGRRQRLRAAEIRELFMEKSGLGQEDVGQVRLFDNYCFIDIATEKAQIATDAMNGVEMRGRPLSVGPAKPRGEMARETSEPAGLSGGSAEDIRPEEDREAQFTDLSLEGEARDPEPASAAPDSMKEDIHPEDAHSAEDPTREPDGI